MPATPLPPDEKVEFQRVQAVLDAFAGLMSQEQPLDDLLTQVAGRAMELTSASGAVVELVEGDELVYVAAVGTTAAHRGLRLARATSLSGLCVATGELQYAPDTLDDPRVDRAACVRIGARSIMAVPLLEGADALGVVKVVSDRPHAFGAVDSQALRLAAGIVAAAIARHRITERHAELARSFADYSARMTSVIVAMPTAMMIHDPDGIIELWNPAAEALIGWPADECIGRYPPYLTPDEAEWFNDVTRQVLWSGERVSVRRVRTDRDGNVLNLRVSAAPVLDADGHIIAVVRTFEDVTAELAHAAAQSALAERMRRVIDRSVDAFVSMDAAGVVSEWNASAEALFGWTREEALGRPLERLIVPVAQRGGHQPAVERYLHSGTAHMVGRRIEVMAQRKDGSLVPIEVSVSASSVEGTVVFDAFMADISARHAERELLQQQALHDALTGLPNRAYFNSHLATVLERHRHQPGRAALMFIDLDGFKAINDTHGHAAGDALLREAARRMRDCVRATDVVARLAGDEFVIVLGDLQDADTNTREIAGKVLAALREPVRFDGLDLSCDASIGIAVVDTAEPTMADLVHRADRAMYQAKRAGGRRAVLASPDGGAAGAA